MLEVLYVVGGLAVLLSGVLAFVFSLGQRSVAYQLRLTLRDTTGNLLTQQRVQVWHRGSTPLEFQTDENGQLQVIQSESFGASILGPRRPNVFTVGLAFPDLSTLYYQFPVKRSGTVTYRAFNTYYDSADASWVGDFDATQCVRSQITYTNGVLQPAVAPTSGNVQRWQATAELQHIGQEQNIHQYALDLSVQMSGVEILGVT
ncbi:hypothetical protein [Hymenobacter fodinae]|uniref:Uncharacterized protein n=1 Tax=Hymenobacter fodinae TaxID=2510796 RepID=A0A4Z0P405_9BACT|nr:hypothetical protein [Hymenobacter fodinae]TGE06140.1 hypothetical protein EU556_14860 [Hymenobacter fodinae]